MSSGSGAKNISRTQTGRAKGTQLLLEGVTGVVGGSPPTVAGVCVLEVGGTMFTERESSVGEPSSQHRVPGVVRGKPRICTKYHPCGLWCVSTAMV